MVLQKEFIKLSSILIPILLHDFGLCLWLSFECFSVFRTEREVKELKEKFLRGKGVPNLVSFDKAFIIIQNMYLLRFVFTDSRVVHFM